jgi:hypothetical protein
MGRSLKHESTSASQRMPSGAVILPLPWSTAPPLAERLVLPEATLTPKHELHLTLLSSMEANALDRARATRDAWRQLVDDAWQQTSSIALTGPYWLLCADKPEGRIWSVVVMVRAAAFPRLRALAASRSGGIIAADAPAHLTLFVAGRARGIGLPSRQEFERLRVRRLTRSERLASHRPQPG